MRGTLSGWAACRHVCLEYTPKETPTLKAGQYKYTGTMPLNIPSSPDPFPLGLHALPLRLLDLSCLHISGTDELTQEEGSTAYTHTRLIN